MSDINDLERDGKKADELIKGLGEEVCPSCGKEHAPGSPEARDCKDNQFVIWATNPDKWEFHPTEDQIDRVKQACARYDAEFVQQSRAPVGPDLQSLRMLIADQFSQPGDDGPVIAQRELMKFWYGMSNDMPDGYQRGSLVHSVDALWQERKLFHIMDKLQLPYRTYDQVDVTAVLNSPPQLRAVADRMEQYEAEGYQLYAREIDEEQGACTWYFRKGKTVNSKETTQS